jgi:Uri superfamily endonuclease
VTPAMIRKESGTYALVFRSAQVSEASIGRLGVLPISRGYYVYVGSAFGPGGVYARVARHVSHSPRRHWHVDYLWPTLRVGEVWYSHDSARREHQWARVLMHSMKASVPLPRFGASDCDCESHLVLFDQRPSFRSFRAHLRQLISHHERVKRVVIGNRHLPRSRNICNKPIQL